MKLISCKASALFQLYIPRVVITLVYNQCASSLFHKPTPKRCSLRHLPGREEEREHRESEREVEQMGEWAWREERGGRCCQEKRHRKVGRRKRWAEVILEREVDVQGRETSEAGPLIGQWWRKDDVMCDHVVRLWLSIVGSELFSVFTAGSLHPTWGNFTGVNGRLLELRYRWDLPACSDAGLVVVFFF